MLYRVVDYDKVRPPPDVLDRSVGHLIDPPHRRIHRSCTQVEQGGEPSRRRLDHLYDILLPGTSIIARVETSLLTHLAIHWTHLLHAGCRDSQLAPPSQDCRTFPCQLQQYRVRHQHNHAKDGGCKRLELGCQGRVLLGRHCSAVHRMGLLPTSRVQGTDILGAGSVV
jgi:hypothetical protein